MIVWNCNIDSNKFSKNYLEKFLVGLLDGDGSIVVDKIKRVKTPYIRIRFIISLKNNEDNYKMLILIKNNICGCVNIERGDKYVTWTCTSKKDILIMLRILEKYPLLSSRKICQYNFIKIYINNPNLDKYVYNRSRKYFLQKELCKLFKNEFKIPDYFSSWLSGFIEAEGSFLLRKNKRGNKHTKCFSIGQNNDEYLIMAIKEYLFSNNKIQFKKCKIKDKSNFLYNNWGGYYKIEIYGAKSRNILYNHFDKHPLLGNKLSSYIKWKNRD